MSWHPRLALLAALAAAGPALADPAKVAFFEKKIRPVLVQQCNNCHSAETNSRGGLRVDDRNGLLTGGTSGPAIVPGHPEKSLLVKAVRYIDGTPKMPPKKQLAPEQIADLERWIKDGAVWPSSGKHAVTPGKTDAKKYERLRREHWAWQPLADPPVPAVKDAAWPRSAIDNFLLVALEAKGLAPVKDADRVTLIRRVTFDLTGLPPTPEEVDAFIGDTRPLAYERLVDRLLASPGFGERWGRHWLDVARYGESTGSSRNLPMPHAWRYRDYVLDAVHDDKPINQFIREQIAGDLLPGSTDEQKIATGFLALGVKDVNQRFKVRFVMDNVDEQIDAVSRAFLGLTASCARCHDHKFDPIPTADYYALAGIFASTDNCSGLRNKMGGGGLDYYDTSMLLRLSSASVKPDPDLPAKVAAATKKYEEAKAAWDKIRGTPEGLEKMPNGQPKQRPFRLRMEAAQAELNGLTDPARGTAAFGVREAKAIGDTAIRIRGEAEQHGPTVPRGFLTLVNVPGAAKVDPKQSGRLQLAEWLASDDNPLTPRVFVNRAWHHLFGAGLVASLDNFGVTGGRPSHPELLDHLARTFVREGWSLKRLVRSLVLTRAYRLGGEVTPAHREADPTNRLLWRHAPRRLSAEELRDATLLASGTLGLRRPHGSPGMTLRVVELNDTGPEARRIIDAARAYRGRSVYLPLVRNLTPPELAAFDPAEQGGVTGARDTTTVAPQALYLLNDPFIRRQSALLAERLSGEGAARVDRAYRLALGRAATAREASRALAYIEDFDGGPAEAWASFCQALIASAEFRHVR